MSKWELKNKETGEHVLYNEGNHHPVYFPNRKAALQVLNETDHYCQEHLEVVEVK